MSERADAAKAALDAVNFPYVVTIDGYEVTMSRPRRVSQNAVGFRARVSLNGESVTDDHVVVNPPLLVPDANGDVERSITDKEGNTSTRRFRRDPLLALAQCAVDSVRR